MRRMIALIGNAFDELVTETERMANRPVKKVSVSVSEVASGLQKKLKTVINVNISPKAI